jgi:Domain of unknown function (DUF5666)
MFSPSIKHTLAKWLVGLSATGLVAACLVACGGGGTSTASNGSGIGSGGTGSFTTGSISGFGSVIVNGIRYDDTGITPSSQDGDSISALKLGMVIDVEGGSTSQVTKASGDVQTVAKASSIKVGFELLGPLDTSLINAGNGTLEVLGQQVQVTVDTFFEPDADLSSLKANGSCPWVKIYGFPRAGTSYTATRIECVSTLPAYFRIRGYVGAVGGGNVTINGHAYPLAGHVTAPQVGQVVRALLRNDASNTVVGFVNDVRAWSQPRDARIEGIVSSYVASSGTFSINGVPVKVDSTTTLNPTNLALNTSNLRVEVRGQLVDGVLKATLIEKEDDRYVAPGGGGGSYPPVSGDREIELHGTVANLNTGLKCFETRGVKVCYTSTGNNRTVFKNGVETDLALGAVVEVRGVRSSSGGYAIVATEIRFSND